MLLRMRRLIFLSKSARSDSNVFMPRGCASRFFFACFRRCASWVGLRGRRRSVVLRDAGSNPPGLPLVFVAKELLAGCIAGTVGAAQRIFCVSLVLLALVGQSGIPPRTDVA